MVSVALNTNGHWCFDHNGANDTAMAVSYRSVTAHLCNAIDVAFWFRVEGMGWVTRYIQFHRLGMPGRWSISCRN